MEENRRGTRLKRERANKREDFTIHIRKCTKAYTAANTRKKQEEAVEKKKKKKRERGRGRVHWIE
jgi:hypothetical protein